MSELHHIKDLDHSIFQLSVLLLDFSNFLACQVQCFPIQESVIPPGLPMYFQLLSPVSQNIPSSTFVFLHVRPTGEKSEFQRLKC